MATLTKKRCKKDKYCKRFCCDKRRCAKVCIVPELYGSDTYVSDEHNCCVDLSVKCVLKKAKKQENPPLTPDELQKMNKEPVWAIIDDFQGWVIIERANSSIFSTFRFGLLPWEEYGKMWVAYRRKLEEDKNETTDNR